MCCPCATELAQALWIVYKYHVPLSNCQTSNILDKCHHEKCKLLFCQDPLGLLSHIPSQSILCVCSIRITLGIMVHLDTGCSHMCSSESSQYSLSREGVVTRLHFLQRNAFSRQFRQCFSVSLYHPIYTISASTIWQMLSSHCCWFDEPHYNFTH